MTSQALLPAHGLATSSRDPLGAACGHDPGIACRLTWDVLHNRTAAQLVNVWLARPATLVLQVLLVLLAAIVIRVLALRLIAEITLHAAAVGRADAPAGERRRQRATALGSVLGNAASVLIFGIAAMTVAGDLGLNLAPLLASAGVLGLAIGFGAQSLVRDFLSGIFMLLEDQYGVGDVIDAGDATGTVEAVSLRVTRLRDVNGVVWHVRNGTINRIGNESQGWARAVIDFPVAYGQDLARMRAAMQETAEQMWSEARWCGVITEKPEVWGVESVTSSTVVMRLVARTLPLRQWEVSRELRERVKVALDAVIVPDPSVSSAISAVAAALGTGATGIAARPAGLRGEPPGMTEEEPPGMTQDE